MTEVETTGGEESQFPGVELAYPIALQSYDVALKRYESMDSRLQTVLGVATTITLAVMAGFKALDIQPALVWLAAALLVFLLAAGIGTYARLSGKVLALDPRILYLKWLRFQSWEFQKNMVYWSGVDLDDNTKRIERKHRLLCFMVFLFLVEAAFLSMAAGMAP